MQATSLVLLSDQQALARTMDIVANNVANSSTTAFKREGIEFSTLLTPAPAGKGINFVVDRATYRDTEGGPIENTNNPLDIAIQGDGYLPVQTTNGSTRYTRGGALSLNSEGQLVTMSGLKILDDGGQPVQVSDDTKDINIAADGTITASIPGQTALSQLAKLNILKFDNDQAVVAEGNGLYSTTQTPTPTTDSAIVQGALEQSNVKPVVEMTQMMQIMRMYEQATNLISQENTRLNEAITKLSKTSV